MFNWTKNLKQLNKGVNQSKIFLMLTTQISLKPFFLALPQKQPPKTTFMMFHKSSFFNCSL